VLQDGVSMLGRIVATWHFASVLDMNCKTWRLAADVLNDIGIALSLVAPFFSSNRLLVLCVAGLMRSLCSVFGGATRSALSQV
jgi:hypothetical protein